MFKKTSYKNIPQKVFDIRPVVFAGSPFSFRDQKIKVDFAAGSYYKETAAKITRLKRFLCPSASFAAANNLLRVFEDIERKQELLRLKNKGARFVVEVPKIELD